jgi:hypothetical protein
MTRSGVTFGWSMSIGIQETGLEGGQGASNHCAHGKSLSTEVTVDWRPFEYSTADSYENGKKTFSETLRFEPLPTGGTRVHDIMQVHLPLPRFLRRMMARYVLVHQMKYDQLLAKAARLAGEDYNKHKEFHEE